MRTLNAHGKRSRRKRVDGKVPLAAQGRRRHRGQTANLVFERACEAHGVLQLSLYYHHQKNQLNQTN